MVGTVLSLHASGIAAVKKMHVCTAECTTSCFADVGSHLEVEVGRVSLWAKSRLLLVSASFVAALRAMVALLPSSHQPHWSPSRGGASFRASATTTQVPPLLCCTALRQFDCLVCRQNDSVPVIAKSGKSGILMCLLVQGGRQGGASLLSRLPSRLRFHIAKLATCIADDRSDSELLLFEAALEQMSFSADIDHLAGTCAVSAKVRTLPDLQAARLSS